MELSWTQRQCWRSIDGKRSKKRLSGSWGGRDRLAKIPPSQPWEGTKPSDSTSLDLQPPQPEPSPQRRIPSSGYRHPPLQDPQKPAEGCTLGLQRSALLLTPSAVMLPAGPHEAHTPGKCTTRSPHYYKSGTSTVPKKKILNYLLICQQCAPFQKKKQSPTF